MQAWRSDSVGDCYARKISGSIQADSRIFHAVVVPLRWSGKPLRVSIVSRKPLKNAIRKYSALNWRSRMSLCTTCVRITGIRMRGRLSPVLDYCVIRLDRDK